MNSALALRPVRRDLSLEEALVARSRRGKLSDDEAILCLHESLPGGKLGPVSERLWGERWDTARLEERYGATVRRIEAWRDRWLGESHSYLLAEGAELKHRSGGSVISEPVLVAMGLTPTGRREPIAVEPGSTHDAAAWHGLFAALKRRGLTRVKLLASSDYPALAASLPAYFPRALRQTCSLEFHESVAALLPIDSVVALAGELQPWLSSGADAPGGRRPERLLDRLRDLGLAQAAAYVAAKAGPTNAYTSQPRPLWNKLYANDRMRRVLREIRENARTLGGFADTAGAVLFSTAALLRITERP